MAGFSVEEKKAIAGLSVVLGLRMLGLSMIIPVFSIYALQLPGSSSILAGMAFGAYGLTQALFQIPFGYYSDRLGRKKVVAFGLILFIIGSVICALTDDIHILIIGRILQGGGAIASACFAWVADYTDPSHRSTAMAFLGIAVGGGIVTGMIIGPMIAGGTTVRFLFWLAAILSLVALIITLIALMEKEKPPEAVLDFDTLDPRRILALAAKPDLIKLNITGFMVNTAMISTFFIVPLRLQEHFDINQLWQVYLPLSIMGGTAMMFTSRKADSGGAKTVIAGALAALSTAFLVLASGKSFPVLLVGFALFFTGFSVLEASLPSAVSKLADPQHKGSIIGVYNFSQFMGTFAGGMMAGFLGSEAQVVIFLTLFVLVTIAALLIMTTRTLATVPRKSG